MAHDNFCGPGHPGKAPSRKLAAVVCALLALASPAAWSQTAEPTQHPEPQRERVRFGGSSTAFPFAMLVAQHMAARTGNLQPIGEATGTQSGAYLFCRGVGLLHPDIAMGSSPLSPEEVAGCEAHGVRDILSIRFGLDALAVVAKEGMPVFDATRKQLWLALAAVVPVEGKLVSNPYQRWRDIDPSLPDLPIRLIGPADGSGKSDTLKSLVMMAGCRDTAEIIMIRDKALRRRTCTTIRSDGAFVPHSLLRYDYAERLEKTDGPAMAFVGLSELSRHAGRITPLAVEGVMPTTEAVRSGRYLIGRSLHFDIKLQNASLVKGMRDFAEEFLRDEAAGEDGYLTRIGLVPLSAEERQHSRESIVQRFGAAP